MYSRSACLLGAVLSVTFVGSAWAVEGSTPSFGGLTVGLPVGITPPPGIYFSDSNIVYTAPRVNGSGSNTGTRLSLAETAASVLVATDYKFLGGRYSFLVGQGYETSNFTTNGGISTTASGLYNTAIYPVDLGYTLSDSLYVRVGVGGYLPTGYYSGTYRHISNGYASLVPFLGLTYLKNGINLTANIRGNINFNNPTTDYHSGNLIMTDYTATKSFGHWTVGVGGYVNWQFTNDTLHGQIVPASANFKAGNRDFQFDIGPYIAYDFGRFSLSASYNHDVVARNYYRVDAGFIRISVPLGNPFTSTRPVALQQIPDQKRP